MLSTILAITNVACGVIMLLLAVPLALGKVRRNLYYGVRLPESFRNERAWTEINRHGGMQLIAFSLLLIAFGVMIFFVAPTGRWTTVLAAAAPAAVLLPALATWRYARRYAASAREP